MEKVSYSEAYQCFWHIPSVNNVTLTHSPWYIKKSIQRTLQIRQCNAMEWRLAQWLPLNTKLVHLIWRSWLNRKPSNIGTFLTLCNDWESKSRAGTLICMCTHEHICTYIQSIWTCNSESTLKCCPRGFFSASPCRHSSHKPSTKISHQIWNANKWKLFALF